jgi:hypothetical protein
MNISRDFKLSKREANILLKSVFYYIREVMADPDDFKDFRWQRFFRFSVRKGTKDKYKNMRKQAWAYYKLRGEELKAAGYIPKPRNVKVKPLDK